MDGENIDLSKRRFIVCIDEIQQNFVFGAEFEGRYGKLMVQIRDLDAMLSESRLDLPGSPVLPRETSLITVPEFVPAGFTQGIEILNDNTTPMEFVTSALGFSLGLSPEDSNRTMLQIHTRGGALLATPSLADAQRVAAQITAEAARHGHPLVCRPVSRQSADGQ